MSKRTVALVMFVEIDDTVEDLVQETTNFTKLADQWGVDEVVNTLNCSEFYLSEIGDPVLSLNEWSDKFNT